MALEGLRLPFDPNRSPEALFRAIRELPGLGAKAVDDLEAAIVASSLPVCDQGAFDDRPRE